MNDATVIVPSITNPRKLHIVNTFGSKVIYDCERFKKETLCAHAIAVCP